MTAEVSGGADDVAARIDRLERRLQRERAAREQAEAIAERGMRDLWQTNRTLETRVAERTVELEGSLAAATMAADAKERFLAELGHELNTPLHAVLGLLELVDAEVLEPVDQERVREVRDHAETLSGLLQGLVELAGAEGAPAPADVETKNVSAWLDTVIDEWTRPAAMRGQLLVPSVVGGELDVALDWRRLTKITGALLHNVVEYADAGAVDVSVTAADGSIDVVVTDSGPGMSADDLARALEPFLRHGLGVGAGAGIGLPVAQRLASGANGTLDIECDGAGTRATVSLPYGR